jgi:hypothetical protein
MHVLRGSLFAVLRRKEVMVVNSGTSYDILFHNIHSSVLSFIPYSFFFFIPVFFLSYKLINPAI